MKQTTMFGDEPAAPSRQTDPQTSKDAGREIAESGTAAVHRCKILNALATAPGGLTAGEIGEWVGMTNVQVSRRTPELERMGQVMRSEPRECSVKRRKMVTWRLREARTQDA